MSISPTTFFGDLYKDYVELNIAASATLPARNCVLRSAVAADITLTLPNVAEARGKFISLQLDAAIGTGKTLTLQDNDDSEDWADLTLDAAKDGVLLFSDGQKWWILVNDIA